MNDIEFYDCSSLVDICSTCLSSNRRLFRVKHLSHFLDINNDTDIFICWECKALLTNFIKFKSRAVKAQQILDSGDKFIPSLSGFTTILNYTYDVINHEALESKISDDEDLPVNNDYDENVDIKEEIKSEHIEFEDKDYTIDDDENASNEIEIENHKIKDGNKNVDRYVVKLLSEEEMIRLRQEKLNSMKFKKYPFRCILCLVGYYSKSQYEEHAIKHTDVCGVVVCDICQLHFYDRIGIQAHCQSHYKYYTCKLCDYSNFDKKLLLIHYFDEHQKGENHKCKLCGKLCSSYRTLRYHRESSHRELPQCKQCGKKFRATSILKRHMLQHTGMPMIECKICKKSYRGEWGLRAHMRTHQNTIASENTYCAECDTKFKNIYLYRRHIKTSLKHVTEDVYKQVCPDCGKRFINKSYMKRHYDAVHLKQTEYVCSICNKCYATASTLRKHTQEVHEGKPKVKNKICNICTKRFATKAILMNHMNSHTGQRPFQCKLCPAKFGQTGALYTHNKLVHLKLKRGEKPNKSTS